MGERLLIRSLFKRQNRPFDETLQTSASEKPADAFEVRWSWKNEPTLVTVRITG